ncbi:MAG: helix-turn-helix transcriptional regulator [Chitinophagales bacterium]
MSTYNFDKQEYSQDIQIDCFMLSEMEENFLHPLPRKTGMYEIFFFTKGKGRIKLDSETISFKEGTIVFLPPGRWRQWIRYSDDVDAYILIFEEAFISDYFHDQLFLYRFHYFYNEASPSYLNCAQYERAECGHVLQKIMNEIHHIGIDSQHYLRSLLYHLLILLNRKYKRDFNVTLELLNDSQSTVFKQLLEERIRSLVHVKDYADEMGISRTQINQIAKRSFGKNAGSIIKERRIAEAKRMILFTNKDIAQIADELNYSEASNFNRTFKTVTGITPAKFRQKNSN